MSVLTYAQRFILAKVLALFYSLSVIFIFALNFIKNPFRSPWATRIRLEPPACLSDPKYGVHKYIKVNNIKLHYVESGDASKRLMIFVHGFPEFWYSWRHQILDFNKDYWCIAVDMRGYGDSERPEEVSAYKIELLIEDLRDLVRQLGREKCTLVSHDWGGLISCRFRDVYPDVLDAVVLLASCSRESWFHEVWNSSSQMKKSWYVFFYQMPVIPEMLLQMNYLEIFDKLMMIEGKDSITAQDIECYKYWFGKQEAFTPPINYYRANFIYTLPEKKFDEAKVPFLAVLAKNDLYLDPSLHDYMKKEYAHLETAIVKDCSHFLQQEEPVKINQMIREFLTKHKL